MLISEAVAVPYVPYVMWNRWYLGRHVRNLERNVMFCKIRGSQGPTEKDEILRDDHNAASLDEEEEKVLKNHDVRNQVV